MLTILQLTLLIKRPNKATAQYGRKQLTKECIIYFTFSGNISQNLYFLDIYKVAKNFLNHTTYRVQLFSIHAHAQQT